MAIDKNSLDSQLVAWVSNWTNLKVEVDLDLFFDLGLDSLHYAELISKVEADLGTLLDFSSLSDWESVRTIGGITEFIVSNLGGDHN